jgi:hypothetical protein
LLVFSLIWGSVPHAFAVTDEERAAARAAAGQGADAFDAGKWQEAVDLFSRAEAVVHSPIHLLFIGRAQANLGHWVKAYEAFNRVKREGAPANAPPAVKKAVDDATAELARLEPQLPYVAVSVKNPSGEVEVKMDDTVVPPALLGLMRPVDPGTHQFQATNGQASSEVVSVEVKPSSRQNVELVLGAASAPVPAAAPPPPETSFAAPPPASDESGTKNGLRIGSYAAFGVGAAGVAFGTVFLLKHLGTKDDADKICPTKSCPPEKQTEQKAKDDDAASQGTLAVIGYAAGGAGIAAGVTLFILSSGSNKSASEPEIRPYIGYQTAGVVGRF